VAGVAPELITFLFHRRSAQSYARAEQLLAELIERLSAFPTPWALKLIAEYRGLGEAHFAQPLSETRIAQACDLRVWFAKWWTEVQSAIEQP
jgi:4-hydroxy-tetrahydrodipicolinate synthase